MPVCEAPGAKGGTDCDPQGTTVMALLRQAVPVQEVIKVDLHIPGCPPSPASIAYALGELIEGRMPNLASKVKFG